MAYIWGLLTTYHSWDDPPSTANPKLYPSSQSSQCSSLEGKDAIFTIVDRTNTNINTYEYPWSMCFYEDVIYMFGSFWPSIIILMFLFEAMLQLFTIYNTFCDTTWNIFKCYLFKALQGLSRPYLDLRTKHHVSEGNMIY